MAVSYKITSTFKNRIVLNYRMPSTHQGKAGVVFSISLPPRALLHEVTFASEDYYNAFVAQNEGLIKSQKIIIGNTTANKAEKISKENTEKESKAKKEKTDSVVDAISNSAESIKAKITSKVSKA